MIKKLTLFSVLNIANKYLAAQAIDNATIGSTGLVTWLMLGVALFALVIGIVNYFRISYNKQIVEVEIVNQKDDLNLTIEAVKISLSREIRYLRKEVGKSQRSPKTSHPNTVTQEKTASENVAEEVAHADKKPFKKRSSNFKKRPPHKRSIEKDIEPEM